MRILANALAALTVWGISSGAAQAANGWSGVQTTRPVDSPSGAATLAAGSIANPSVPPALGAVPGPVLGLPIGTSAEETAARWGLAAVPLQPPVMATDEANAKWGVPPTPVVAPPAPPPPLPKGPPPPNPYIATDYTAYTLELGEIRIGFTEVGLGVAPRVQIATSPLVYALGAWNVRAKADVVRAGPFDFAIVGSANGLIDGREFQAFWTRVGGIASVRATKMWTLHAGGGWDHIYARGLPSQNTLRNFAWDEASRADIDTWYDAAKSSNSQLDARQELLSVRAATDVRFNRRDALVLQGSGIAWGAATTHVTAVVDGEVIELPPILGLDELVVDAEGASALGATWQASLAYQATFRYMQVRLGWGVSAEPWTWVPNTLDMSWRFGGPTRREEAAQWTRWRTDQRVSRKARNQGRYRPAPEAAPAPNSE
jgi:hypothetical protein